MPRLTRRRLLGAASGGALGIAAGGGFALGRTSDDASGAGATTIPFYGERQAGITTPSQDRLAFGALDLTVTSAAELRELLRTWTTAAERMTRGVPAGDPGREPLAPPEDTGEALDLHAARLTITIGFGPGLFERDGDDRYGLASRRPRALRTLPPLPGEDLEPGRSGGDLCVQACADDPQVAFHAVRNLTRLARGAATLRWTQLGFGRTSSVTSSQQTMRNLQGFKDGTNNLKSDDEAAVRKHVIVGDDEPQRWLRGGSYLVARRIRMLIEAWDRTPLDEQELTIGRRKLSGAPLTGEHEHDALDFKALAADGKPAMPLDAHVRLAAPETNGGVAILRRGYSYTDGIDAASGQLDAGLFFISFQRDPQQFVALQRRLGATDALNEYIRHTGSAVFAVPPGARPAATSATACCAPDARGVFARGDVQPAPEVAVEVALVGEPRWPRRPRRSGGPPRATCGRAGWTLGEQDSRARHAHPGPEEPDEPVLVDAGGRRQLVERRVGREIGQQELPGAAERRIVADLARRQGRGRRAR